LCFPYFCFRNKGSCLAYDLSVVLFFIQLNNLIILSIILGFYFSGAAEANFGIFVRMEEF
jgi:hypothetical protein